MNLPSNSATYPIYGEYRLKQTAEDGTDTSTLSTASSPFYVALNLIAPTVVMSTPAGLILDDDATTQLQYINGTEAQWVTFSAVGANGESITTQVNICPSTGL